MAQIIKHRRGSLEALSAVTSSLQKGEIVIASGSSNLSVSNGASIVFAVPENGQVQAVNRVLRGTAAPSNFASATYNGLVDGVPYYASGSSTLFLLGSDGNEAINLVGNIQPFSTSVNSRLGTIETSLGGGGSIGTRVSALEATSASLNSFTQSFSQSVASDLSSSNAATAANLSSYSASAASSLANTDANISSLSTSIDGRVDKLEASQSAFDNAVIVSGQNVTINGNFVVSGTTTTVDSTTVSIGDNIISLNGTGGAYGGIEVKDPTAPNTVSGSLLWDTAHDRWIAGPKGAESNILLAGGDNVVSGSSQITISSTTGFSDFSSSLAAKDAQLFASASDHESRIDTIEASLGGGGSIGSRVSNLEVHSGSINSFTQSYFTDSASFDTRIDNVVSDLSSVSGAFAVSVSASKAEYTAFSASAASNLSAVSGAFASTVANLNSTFATDAELSTVSGAFATTISNLGSTFATDAELSAVSAAVAVRDAGQDTVITNLSSSANARLTSLENKSGSLATTGSNTFIGTQTISGSLNVSGSTNFNGAVAVNDANMNLTNSSSLNLTSGSSIYVSAEGSISGSIAGIGNVTTFSSSVNSRLLTNVDSAAGAFASASAHSASLASTINTLSTSVDSRLDTIETSLGGGGSIGARVSSLEATSASLNASASNHEGRIDILEASQSAFDSAITLSGQNVTIAGNLTVAGTQTIVDSTTVQIGDNIIELNGTGAQNGGLLVKDVTAPNTVSGSLLWDSTGDFWKAGALNSEHRILTVNDGVVSGSSQITISSTTGFSTFDTAISTSFSASNASIAANSASIASSLNSVSGAFATSVSASNASITSLSSSVATSFSGSSASVTALSSSVATSFSASEASVTSLSTSVDSRLDVLEGNVGQALNTNSNVTFNSVTASVNLGSAAGNTKRIAFRNTNGNLDLVPTASVSGDLLQWNGSDFVMSNTIDGGSF